jgi:glycosyltransferase involved in cell wall biosynthesis
VDVVDREDFETVIKPLIRPPHVEYIGEVNDVEKSEFLGGARALLFPIDWPEPFGLAMVEALACGTPVIARPYGSVPEVMKPGVSGFVADGIDEMVAAVHKVESLPREQCRAYFEERFTVEKMVDKYEQVYARLIGSKQTAPRIFFEQPAAAR